MATNITATTTEVIPTEGLSGDALQIAILVTLFLGITARTYIYFLVEKRKAEQLGEEPLKFNSDFLITAIIAAVGSGFIAMLTFQEAALLVPQGTSAVGVFIIVGGFAFGSNEILNKVLSFIDFQRLLNSPKLQNAVQALQTRKQEREGNDSQPDNSAKGVPTSPNK